MYLEERDAHNVMITDRARMSIGATHRHDTEDSTHRSAAGGRVGLWRPLAVNPDSDCTDSRACVCTRELAAVRGVGVGSEYPNLPPPPHPVSRRVERGGGGDVC